MTDQLLFPDFRLFFFLDLDVGLVVGCGLGFWFFASLQYLCCLFHARDHGPWR